MQPTRSNVTKEHHLGVMLSMGETADRPVPKKKLPFQDQLPENKGLKLESEIRFETGDNGKKQSGTVI